MPAGKICTFWLQGRCNRGGSCKFIHGTGVATMQPKYPHGSSHLATFRKQILGGTGVLLKTIEPYSLAGAAEVTDSDTNISLADYEFLSSYNWVNRDTPVIYVPGAPPVWRSKKLPFRVAKDQGTYFIDQNTARSTAYPTEPLFRSLAVMQPNFSMRDVDLVTDRNCLRKLLRFVSEDVDRSFRIDVKIHGGVMFLCRWEAELEQKIHGSQSFGYGHNFEKATTTFEGSLRDSSGHHRVARYSLGGVRCLMRFEADGYSSDTEDTSRETTASKGDNTDDLLGPLQSLSITSPQADATGSVLVLNKGRVVEPSTIVEIKTRSAHRRLHLEDTIPQLWFSQTQNLFVGYHTNGQFQEVEKLSMKLEFERWEEQHQDHLKKLVGLLKQLKHLVSSVKGQKCVAYVEKNSVFMRIYEPDRMGAALPDDILKQYQWAAA